jgi:acyl carrier protein phosphodiesterase
VNFLAHAFLAGDAPELVVGGVIGDWIKGPLPGALPRDLARGVALHRAIDSYTERHPAFCASRARMSAARRRYAGVLVDIFYDHLLALNWARHHPQPLDVYSASVYAQIASTLDQVPPHAHRALTLMAAEDWFVSYAQLGGIADVLARMSRRARQPNPLAGAQEEFAANAVDFARDFEAWLEDTAKFAADWRGAGRGASAN